MKTLELLQPGTNPIDAIQRDVRTQESLVLSRLNIIQPGESIREVRQSDNVILLNNGTYPRVTLTTSGTSVTGQPGTSLAATTLSGAYVRIDSVRFTGLVTLAPTARVTFTNCRFSAGVLCQAGSKAGFSACIWDSGYSIDNSAGLVGDVTVVAGGRGATAHLGCTILSEWIA